MNIERAMLNREPGEPPTRWTHKRVQSLELLTESELDGIAESGWLLIQTVREGGLYTSFFKRRVTIGPSVESRGCQRG